MLSCGEHSALSLWINRSCKLWDASAHVIMNNMLNLWREQAVSSEVERVKIMWLLCLCGKTRCLTSDLPIMWVHEECIALAASCWGCDSALCWFWEENLSLAEVKRKIWDLTMHGVCFWKVLRLCCVVMCCVSNMQTSLLGAITSWAWQSSELVSCSSSPGTGGMMRLSVVNKQQSSRKARWCTLCTVWCSRRTGRGNHILLHWSETWLKLIVEF